ncbi:uncharacterized protein LOC119067442 isoform X2 [Bradysia coprophila]|uniref:uncharacterized protein LOC119067442 isoform X2 n=1 Tax=Bradysia coprophila TaxID=38358 RepID=UPI00187DA1BE|nr:uncharacterized protein LOC119067442 isoform X2 [Bradysia coprophila]
MMLNKRRNNKKNKLEEVVKPRGFERGLTLEKIVGVTNCKNELMFLLKWNDCLEYDLVKASEVNEKCPDIVIEYYESRCPINQKCDNNVRFSSRYESELIENPAPIRDQTTESEPIESKDVAPTDAADAVLESSENLSYLEESSSNKAAIADNDVVNAAFSINVDDANSVQVSYSLPMIENLSGEELMETQMPNEQGSRDTSNCHMPDLQDVEMQ